MGTPHTVSAMMTNTPLSLCLLLAASVHGFPSLNQTETKAASNLVNCGCQCSSLTFRDAKGEVQGNCLTVDSTGAQWCYVDSEYSSCQDTVPSLRFPNNPWSYEACATPAPGSLLCPLAPTSADHHNHHHYPTQAPVIAIIGDNQRSDVIGEHNELESSSLDLDTPLQRDNGEVNFGEASSPSK